MTSDSLQPPGDGHTELSDDERQGLIPTYIATRGELNEAEQRNITSAVRNLRPSVDELLDDIYLMGLHRRMFGGVWTWAGQYRTRDTNLGVPFERIAESVRSVVLDARTWIDANVYEIEEGAVRYHHRLVAVHPFPNGNGRHSRIVADLLVAALGGRRLSWGANLGVSRDELRQRYIAALRAADAGDLGPLISFAVQ